MLATDPLRTAARAALLAVAIAAGTGAIAQTSRQSVTEADMERIHRQQPVLTDADVERARKAHRMPSEQELSRVPIPSTPNVDALPKPAARKPIDLEALAKGYERAIGGAVPQSMTRSGPGLLVFVSFSMPHEALSRLVDQASRSGATLVLRGFVNGSLKETVTRVQGS